MTHWMIWNKIINPSFTRKEKRNREKKLSDEKSKFLPRWRQDRLHSRDLIWGPLAFPCAHVFALGFLLSFSHFLPHFCSVRHSFNLRPSIFIMRIMISIYLLGRSHICKWILCYSIILFAFFFPLIFPFSCPFLNIYLIVWIRKTVNDWLLR